MSLNTQLFKAVANNNLETNSHIAEVEKLLNTGANVDTQDGDFITPLQLAAARGDLKMVELLVNHGADIRLADQLGFTPFLHAVCSGHINIILCLLLHYPRPEVAQDETTYLGATPMTLACGNGNLKVIQLLNKLGFSTEPLTRFYWCPSSLMAAMFCKRGYINGEWVKEINDLNKIRKDMLFYLLDRNLLASKDYQLPRFGNLNALALAAICNQIDIYDLLVGIEARNKDVRTEANM